jgi:hypothetical protein
LPLFFVHGRTKASLGQFISWCSSSTRRKISVSNNTKKIWQNCETMKQNGITSSLAETEMISSIMSGRLPQSDPNFKIENQRNPI